jgi:hypothetical protein
MLRAGERLAHNCCAAGCGAERRDSMNDAPEDGQGALVSELHRLRMEHRDLDAAILALEGVGPADQLQIQRLKKRKLYLKDRIIRLEDQLTPDIIA